MQCSTTATRSIRRPRCASRRRLPRSTKPKTRRAGTKVFQMDRFAANRRSWVRVFLAILIPGAVLAISALQFTGSRAVAQRAFTDEDRFTAYMFARFRKAMPKAEVRAIAPLTLAIGPGKGAHT